MYRIECIHDYGSFFFSDRAQKAFNFFIFIEMKMKMVIHIVHVAEIQLVNISMILFSLLKNELKREKEKSYGEINNCTIKWKTIGTEEKLHFITHQRETNGI